MAEPIGDTPRRNAPTHPRGRVVTWLALLLVAATPSFTSAADRPIAGHSLRLSDVGDAARRAGTFRAFNEPNIDLGILPDPRRHGATVEITGAGAGFGSTGRMFLPPENWTGSGRPAGSRGYRYRDRSRDGGIRSVSIRPGRRGGRLSIYGRSWPFAVDNAQSVIEVRLTIGRETLCAVFPNDSLATNRAGRVLGRKAPRRESCTRAACGNGVLEAGEECDDGNLDAGDCCDRACRHEAEGATCNDAHCTDAGTCADGACRRAGSSCDELPLLCAASTTAAELSFRNGIASGVRGRIPTEGRTSIDRARHFLDRFPDLYDRDDDDRALLVRRVTSGDLDTVRFYQTYNGLEVVGGELVVGLDGNDVVSAVASLLPDVAVETWPLIYQSAAEQIARRAEGGRLAGPTSLVVWDSGLIGGERSNPRLAWRVVLRGSASQQVFVDSQDGSILAKLPSGLEHGAAFAGIEFDLQDAENEASAAEDSCFDLSDDPLIADETGFNATFAGDTDAVFAHAYILNTYQWYHTRFGRHSFDNAKSRLEVFIRTDGASSWSNDCQTMQISPGQVDFDVIVHEFNHGVIGTSSKLVYACDSGSLNESYADVMAAIADREMYVNPNWTIAENQTDGSGAIRSLENPQWWCDPDHRYEPTQFTEIDNDGDGLTDEDPTDGADNDGDGQTDEDPPECPGIISYTGCPAEPDRSNDWGGVHSNSSIPNRTAHLMAEGGFLHGVNVTGMGAEKTVLLKYDVMRELPSGATFQQAADAEIAKALHWTASATNSFTIGDICTVRNAWAAVGVVDNDLDCDGTPDGLLDTDNDGVLDNLDNCIEVPNPNQVDSNLNGFGDACESGPNDDKDSDGILNHQDCCETFFNPDQPTGCSCEDFDGDTIPNHKDNCPFDKNYLQADSDMDGDGDACEVDTDGDGVPNDTDNCPAVPNPNQDDLPDMDGIGNACDECDEAEAEGAAFGPGTTIFGPDGNTITTGWGEPYQPDSDGDGIPDECDPVLYFDSVPGLWKDLGLRQKEKKVELDTGSLAARHAFVEIEPCEDGCREVTEERIGALVRLRDFPAGLRAWIADDVGNMVAKLDRRGTRGELRFLTEGGRRYFLHFYATPQLETPRPRFTARMAPWRAPRTFVP